MKKITFIGSLLVIILGYSISFAAAPAAQTNAAAGGSLSLTDAETNPNTVAISFSPSVWGKYQPDLNDAENDVQWYAITTYHSGGTTYFGASNDSTALYSQEIPVDGDFTSVTIPTTAVVAADDITGELPADTVWTNNGWTK